MIQTSKKSIEDIHVTKQTNKKWHYNYQLQPYKGRIVA